MVMDILAMKTRDGEPGLYAAMENNHPCVSHGSSLKFMESLLNITSAKLTSWIY